MKKNNMNYSMKNINNPPKLKKGEAILIDGSTIKDKEMEVLDGNNWLSSTVSVLIFKLNRFIFY